MTELDAMNQKGLRCTGYRMDDEQKCPRCGGTGHSEDFHFGRGRSTGSCPFCFVSLRLAGEKGESLHIEVSGTNADDVDRVFYSSFRHARGSMAKGEDQVSSEVEAADVAILVALPKELDSVLKAVGAWDQVQYPDQIRTYYRSMTPKGVSIVAARCSEMGQLGAAMLARDVLERFRPKKMILVGIAGGIGSDVDLGDIVVSDQIVDYELGKVTEKGLTPRWSVYRSDAMLHQRLMDFKGLAWLSMVQELRPDGTHSVRPKIHSGLVLSGNKVIADSQAAGSLTSIWTRALAIEMEAAGIAAAIHQSAQNVPFIMVKGVCDRADLAKNDDWQKYAADVAAAFTIAFVYTQLLPSDARSVSRELPKRSTSDQVGHKALRTMMADVLSLSELRVLISDLGYDWENIRGETKDERIVETIEYVKRRNSLDKLIAALTENRPDLLDAFVAR